MDIHEDDLIKWEGIGRSSDLSSLFGIVRGFQECHVLVEWLDIDLINNVVLEIIPNLKVIDCPH